MQISEMVYGVLVQPVVTFRYLGQARPLGRTLGVWLLALTFSAVVSFSLIRGEMAALLPEVPAVQAPVMGNLFWLYGVGYLVLSLGWWLVVSALYGLLGELLGGVANGTGVLTCLALAGLPGALGPALQLLSRAASVRFAEGPLLAGVFLWTAVLQVLALRESLQVDTGRAFVIWVAPFLVVGLMLLVGVLLLAALMFTVGLNL